MPTYDYVCDNCRHEFETFQSITEAPLKKCPECGKAKLRRLIGSGAALIFRGSGFYCTDYRKGGSSAPTSGGAKSSSGEGAPAADGGKSDGSGKSDSGAGKSNGGKNE